jgi:hypothetical protein
MKLSEIAAKPKLIKVILDDEEVVQEFGESLEFWTWDRQPMEVFLKMSSIDTENYSVIIDTVKTMILDEKGAAIIKDDIVLPTNIMLRAINKIVEKLGKF